ncbi:DNA polymerase III subunit delta [Thalassotalea ganghwensis]
MRIYHNQLSTTLRQGLAPIWLVFGDEPWQKNDAIAQIRATAQQQGFDELLRFYADDKFDWQQIDHEYHSMSLFAQRKIIEIELVSFKLNDAATKYLEAIAADPSPDIVVLIYGDKIDGASQKRKWFKALDKAGIFMPLYDIEGKHLSQWIFTQCKKLSLTVSNDVVNLLCHLFEGNLLALYQELTKLSILYGSTPIDVENIEKLVIKQARFTAFQLSDAMLAGNIKQCFSMLTQLEDEGIHVAQLVWPLHREISQLLSMKEQFEQGIALVQIFSEHKVWEKRKPLYQQALKSTTLENLAIAQQRLAQVDILTKTTSEFNGYQLLADVIVCVQQGQQLSNLSLDLEYI